MQSQSCPPPAPAHLPHHPQHRLRAARRRIVDTTAPLPVALLLAIASLHTLVACSKDPAGASTAQAALRLADEFDKAVIEGDLPDPGEQTQIDWRFDRPWEPLPPEAPEDAPPKAPPDSADGHPQTVAPTDATPHEGPKEAEEEDDAGKNHTPGPVVHGAEALVGIEDLALTDGRLRGQITGPALLRLERRADGDEPLHGVEIKLRLIDGGTVGAFAMDDKEIDRAELREELLEFGFFGETTALPPSAEVQTCVVPLNGRSANTSKVRHLLIQPGDSGHAFELESVRLISQKEHLATQRANIDWRGLGEIYRRALLMHTTETVHFDLTLPTRPWLDLAVGTVEAHPTTFVVEIAADGEDSSRLLRRTITTENRWEETPLDLSAWAGKEVRITFRLQSDHSQQTGYFGGLVLHNRGATPSVNGTPLTGAPRGVVFVLVDTLRRDHLDAYGYGRETAPFLSELAARGALFKDDIAQASWTKVSVPSILTSLYPVTSGVTSMKSKVPLAATTLAECFQAAGYATFATSSVAFSGRATNLHQGLDVLHERASIGDLGHSPSKTARTYVDRLTEWLEVHREQPFFVFLHLFDPHSPFDTYAPYSQMWSEEGGVQAQKEDIEKVQALFKDIRRGGDLLPDRTQLEQAGVPVDAFVAREHDWYDESIRAMDAELRRLVERTEELGLADDTLIVFTSDHGEEFLEHGRHFHGNSTYGEMTNVPLMFYGPRWVPAGTVVEETVQTLDVYPTLLELCGIPAPDGIQGVSLTPLLRGSGTWRPRPAYASQFSEKKVVEETKDIASFAVVSRGYRLVQNVKRPEGHAEFELYDHRNDPLNARDLAAEMPEKVKVLAREIELWHKLTKSQALVREDGEDEVEMSAAELEQLRQLGYIGGDD